MSRCTEDEVEKVTWKSWSSGKASESSRRTPGAVEHHSAAGFFAIFAGQEEDPESPSYR